MPMQYSLVAISARQIPSHTARKTPASTFQILAIRTQNSFTCKQIDACPDANISISSKQSRPHMGFTASLLFSVVCAGMGFPQQFNRGLFNTLRTMTQRNVYRSKCSNKIYARRLNEASVSNGRHFLPVPV